ncbi:MAG: ATP-binding cassette domain-containing protein [Flavobacteriia bacterium]|nr:ATP-binding cassette domain-containing protein [Flavobacteriia bacterium]OJX36190.1 MAG: ABC transporter ATP-binding protein [Flavobacteriia bacterium 40-80]
MITLEGVSKSFQQKIAVHDVSFSLEKGKILGLLGPNGAGKTTIIRMMNRIFVPDKGSIFFNGELLNQKHLRHIGYLPEERGLYKTMTVWEHIKLIGQLRGLSKEDITSNYKFWEEKFDISSWKSKRIEELSKGMAQKVQFICTIIHQPDVLILDEPFSGFDPVNIELIQNEIKAMKDKGKTILLSSHNMKSVEELCDKVVLINQSKKVLEGNVYDLRSQKGEDIYAIRFRGNMIAFVNALWIGFELVGKEELSSDTTVAYVKMRNESTFEDLLRTLLGQVEIEAAWKVLTSMQEIFIQEVAKK